MSSAGQSKWATMPCVGFDLETTGTDTGQDRIVQAAIVEIKPDAPARNRVRVSTWLVNPGIDIPAEASEVHGISTEHARTHGMDPAQAVFEITGALALALGRRVPVVAFNAAFDLTMLEAENQRHAVDTLTQRLGGHAKVAPVIDPMVLANYAEPFRKKICACGCGATDKTLAGWCRHYRVVNVGAHDAAGDAQAACRLWPRILDGHDKKFRGFTLPALHQAQVMWRKEQADRLREYFDKVGTEHDGIDPGWPIYDSARTLTAGAR